MNVDNEEISAFCNALKAIEEFESLYEFPETKWFFFCISQRNFFLSFFEDVANLHDYLNKLNELFKKYNYFDKFCWSGLEIYIFL